MAGGAEKLVFGVDDGAGGPFGALPSYCRSAIRGGYGPANSQPNIGFRIVLAP